MSSAGQKVAWIVGAGTAWGRAVSLALASRGYDLALQDRTPLKVEQTAELARALGRTARVYITEIGKGLPARAFVEEALEDWGRVDVLVNALWVAPPASLLKLDEWDWQNTLEINLSGPLLLMQNAAEIQRGHGGGMIFNLLPCETSHSPALSLTTAALQALSELSSAEFLAYNIAVHAVRLTTLAPPAAEPPEILHIIERLP